MAKKYINSKKYRGVYYFIENNEKYYLFRFSYQIPSSGKPHIKYITKIVGRASQGVTDESTFLAKIKCREEYKDSRLDFTPTLNAIADKYFMIKAAQMKSFYKVQGIYNKHIRKYPFAELPIDKLQSKDIVVWQNILLLEYKLSRKTVHIYNRLITTILNFAKINHLDNGYLQDNVIPSSIVNLKKADKQRTRVLSNEEVQKLLNFLLNLKTQARSNDKKENLSLFVLLALNTGGRFRAIMDIRKKDINFESLTINLRDTKVNRTFSAFINKNLYPILEEKAMQLQEPDALLFGETAKDNKSIKNFEIMLLRALNKLFNKGLSTKDSENRVVIHTFRHTFATSLISKGTPLLIVQKQLNHSSHVHTKRYITLSAESGREYLERLDYHRQT